MSKTTKVQRAYPSFLERTNIYGFELFMALFGLVTTLVVIDYGIFALLNYLQDSYKAAFYDADVNAWVVAALVVWLPVTAVFYLRSRHESGRDASLRESGLHKLLISLYYFCIILGAIGLCFLAVYAIFYSAITADGSFVDMLVRIVIPALISALLHVAMLFAFTKSNRPSGRLFIGLFSLVAVAVGVALLLVSIAYSSQNGRGNLPTSSTVSSQSVVSARFGDPA